MSYKYHDIAKIHNDKPESVNLYGKIVFLGKYNPTEYSLIVKDETSAIEVRVTFSDDKYQTIPFKLHQIIRIHRAKPFKDELDQNVKINCRINAAGCHFVLWDCESKQEEPAYITSNNWSRDNIDQIMITELSKLCMMSKTVDPEKAQKEWRLVTDQLQKDDKALKPVTNQETDIARAWSTEINGYFSMSYFFQVHPEFLMVKQRNLKQWLVTCSNDHVTYIGRGEKRLECSTCQEKIEVGPTLDFGVRMQLDVKEHTVVMVLPILRSFFQKILLTQKEKFSKEHLKRMFNEASEEEYNQWWEDIRPILKQFGSVFKVCAFNAIIKTRSEGLNYLEIYATDFLTKNV